MMTGPELTTCCLLCARRYRDGAPERRTPTYMESTEARRQPYRDRALLLKAKRAP